MNLIPSGTSDPILLVLYPTGEDTLNMVSIRHVAAFVALSALVVLACYVLSDDSSAGGDCGGGITWEVSGDTLTLEKTGDGDGRMVNYNTKGGPWTEYYGIQHVVLGDGIVSIGRNAFYQMKMLESVDTPSKPNSFPDSLTSIGAGAFYQCLALGNFEFPDSLTYIGPNAFVCCKSLTSVTIPKGVTRIEDGTFWSCYNLEDVHLPDTLTSIGYYGFACIDSLDHIAIPDSVVEIGSSAFGACSRLVAISFSKNVKVIGPSAFSNQVFHDKDGKVLKATAKNLAGRTFEGDSADNLKDITSGFTYEDDGSDSEPKTMLYVCAIGVLVLAVVSLLTGIVRPKHRVRRERPLSR